MKHHVTGDTSFIRVWIIVFILVVASATVAGFKLPATTVMAFQCFDPCGVGRTP